MKLLFDQNLSPRLVERLADIYPDSSHVFLLGLDRASDQELWEFAARSGFAITTRDADFADLAGLRGPPPLVVWLRLGNCTTARIEQVLRRDGATVRRAGEDPTCGLILLI